MISAGVNEPLAMKISGHRSEAGFRGYIGQSMVQQMAIADIAGIGGERQENLIVPNEQLTHNVSKRKREPLGEISYNQQNIETHHTNTQQTSVHYSSPNKRTLNHYHFAGATFNLADGSTFTFNK